MASKVLFVIILSVLSQNLIGLEVGVEAGYSYFNYAEVGPNNKDDLYTMKSVLIGLLIKKEIENIELIASGKAQLPFNLGFTDALGTDGKNYLESLLFYGINIQSGVLYPIKIWNVVIAPGVVLNYDYFYFKELLTEPYSVYQFAVLGAGLAVDVDLYVANNFTLGFKASGIVDFLPFGRNSSSLLWSYNANCTLFASYNF